MSKHKQSPALGLERAVSVRLDGVAATYRHSKLISPVASNGSVGPFYETLPPGLAGLVFNLPTLAERLDALQKLKQVMRHSS